MKQRYYVYLSLCLLATLPAIASSWYVRPGGKGSKTGADWNNSVDFSSALNGGIAVAAGDTIWVSGEATYTSTINVTKSGTVVSPIYIKRVKSTDSVPTAAAGWSSTFDAQVLVHPPNGGIPVMWYSSPGSYLYFDGRQDRGMTFYIDPSTGVYQYGGAIFFYILTAPAGNITFTNIEMMGASSGDTLVNRPVENYYDCGFSIDSASWAGGSAVSNILLTNCRLHGNQEQMCLYGAQNITFTNCLIYDNVASGPTHANLLESGNCSGILYINCNIWNWQIEGFRLYNSGYGSFTVAGCIMHDPYNVASTVARCFENDSTFSGGPVCVLNNTFCNIATSVLGVYSSSGSPSPSGGCTNNLYVNCSSATPFWGTPSHELVNPSTSVMANYQAENNTSPMTDFSIVSTVGSGYPRNAAVTLAAQYSIDMLGDVRGSDGVWDIGAIEYSTGGGCTAPSISQSPTSQTNAVGASPTYTVLATGTTNLYQWSSNGTNIPGATTASLTLNNVQLSNNGETLFCGVTNGCGYAVSATATNYVVASPVININLSSLAFGDWATQTVSSLPVRVWNSGSGVLSGLASTATPFTISNGTYNLSSGQTQTVYVLFSPTANAYSSGTVTFSGGVGVTIPVTGWGEFVQPVSNLQTKLGTVTGGFIFTNNVMFQTNDNSGSPGAGGICHLMFNSTTNGSISFLWRTLAPGQANNSFYVAMNRLPVDPGDTSDLNTNSSWITQAIAIRGNSTNAAPTGATDQYPTNLFSIVASNNVLVIEGREPYTFLSNLWVNVPASCTAPVITQNPSSTGVPVGSAATFTVGATGTSLQYQWLLSGSSISGATAISYTKSNCQLSDSGDSFSVWVSNSCGVVTSSAATLTVTNTGPACVAPVITQNPANQTVSQGQSASFGISATGTTNQYQWLLAGVPIASATTVSYAKVNCQPSDSGDQFSCWASNSCGVVTSTVATLTVTYPAPVITTQLTNQSAFQGQTLTYVVGASGSLLAYQWYWNGSVIAAATASSYTTPTLQITNNGDQYFCAVTNAGGLVNSATAIQTVGAISTQPQPQTTTNGGSATFTVVVTSSISPTYQWLWNNSVIGGATASSFTTNSVPQSAGGSSASVLVSLGTDTIQSQQATLTVNAPQTNSVTVIINIGGRPVTIGPASF